MTMMPQSRARASHLRRLGEVPEFSSREGPREVVPEVVNACKDCRWAQPAPRPGSFQCRRWPPVVLQARHGEAVFPIVNADDYCGEFQQ
jgi:hypothetical protein